MTGLTAVFCALLFLLRYSIDIPAHSVNKLSDFLVLHPLLSGKRERVWIFSSPSLGIQLIFRLLFM